eukprot:TRINITY_DN51999_c0_g1_i1.p1 TRINITY_DN51999_c0_g1~~TRINITY_DN51999_c0_g1_i1.p1  ORF type:complete len:536 (+),score=231.46 TRINITY_DN51999_c0_g1_i1:178-1785(+)
MSVPTRNESHEKLALACDVALQHFGVVPHLIVTRLVQLGPATVTQLAHHCSSNIPVGILYDHTKLRRALVVLIHHGVVGFRVDAPTQYYCMPDMLVMRIKHPSMIQTSKQLFGDEGGQLTKLLLQHGRASDENLVEFALQDPTGPYCQLPPDAQMRKRDQMHGRLHDMIAHHFVEPASKVNFNIAKEERLQGIERLDAEIEKKGKKTKRADKRKRDVADSDMWQLDDIDRKSPQQGEPGADPAGPTLLRVNVVKFLHHQRSSEAIDLVKRIVNDSASHLVECMLRYPQRVSSIVPADIQTCTCPVPPMPPVSEALREEQLAQLTGPEVTPRLKELLTGLSSGLAHLHNYPILKLVNPSKGHAVNMAAITAALRNAQIEYIISKKCGTVGRRIFKILMQKKALEEKDIVSQALAPEADVRQTMYRMKSTGYLSVREVPMTADMNPNKTIFLWGVPYEAVQLRIVDEMYKTLRNMYQKRLHAASEVAPLLARLSSSGKTHGLTEQQLEQVAKWNSMSESLTFTIVSLYDSICSLEFF